MKRGILKTHKNNQSPTYEYWRTVIPDDPEIKKTVLKELHWVPYVGHPGFARTLEVVRTARRGSQVPVRFLFVDGIEMQPRVRQQAVTFVNTCARRTGRSYAKRRDGETLTQLSRHGDNSPVRQEVLQRSRAATRSINILALVSYIRVLISRTCNHLSFPIGTPRSHRSLPWALHLPRAAHAAAKLPTLF